MNQLFRSLLIALNCVACCGSFAVGQELEQPNEVQPQDQNLIERFDPFREELVAVAADDVKPGYLYLHYNARLGRRVWSLADSAGKFAYALGEGTTQPAARLDLRASQRRTEEALERGAPRYAENLRTLGAKPFVELTAEGKWELPGRPVIPTVFDLETGRRWEWHGERRVAVIHLGGYGWEVRDDKYVPAGSAGWGPDLRGW